METLLTSLGGPLGQCLDNEPVSTFYDVACGNGILEEKEACDCGSAEVYIVCLFLLLTCKHQSRAICCMNYSTSKFINPMSDNIGMT